MQMQARKPQTDCHGMTYKNTQTCEVHAGALLGHSAGIALKHKPYRWKGKNYNMQQYHCASDIASFAYACIQCCNSKIYKQIVSFLFVILALHE